MQENDEYIVTVGSNGKIPIPYEMLKQCKWLRTHEILVIKRRFNKKWQIILRPGKKLGDQSSKNLAIFHKG